MNDSCLAELVYVLEYAIFLIKGSKKSAKIIENKQKTSELKHTRNEFEITKLPCTERSLIEDKLPSAQSLKILLYHPTHTLETSIFV